MPKVRSHGVDTELRVEQGKVYARRKQESESQILEDNARKRASGYRKSDFMRPMASIPNIVTEKLKQTRPEVLQDRRAMERFLNSSEGRAYSTTQRGSSRARVFMGKSHYGR